MRSAGERGGPYLSPVGRRSRSPRMNEAANRGGLFALAAHRLKNPAKSPELVGVETWPDAEARRAPLPVSRLFWRLTLRIEDIGDTIRDDFCRLHDRLIELRKFHNAVFNPAAIAHQLFPQAAQFVDQSFDPIV